MGGAGREIHGLDEQQLHQKMDQGWKKVGRDRLRESRWWQKAACRERARTVDVFEVVDWPVSCAFRGLVTGGCEETLLGEVGAGFEAGAVAAVDVRAGVLDGVFVADVESDFNFVVVVEAGFR